jgi:putative cell wall-binding protein
MSGSSVREQLASVSSHWRLVVRTLGARDGSTRRVSLRQRLTAGVALSVAAASVVIVGTSVPALATVSGVSVTPIRAAAGATTNYTVAFTTTVALTIDVDSITLVAPNGTVFPAAAGAYTVNGTVVSAAPTVSAHTVTIVTHVAVPAGAVTVIASGVTNPGAGVGVTMTAQTSQEVTPVTSAGYTITAATAVTAVTVPSVVPAQVRATNATYTVAFTAATAMVATVDTITITAPSGTVFLLVAADYSIQVGGTAQVETVTPTQTALSNVTLKVPAGATGGAAPISGTVIASNVTNPSIASTTETLTVSTSQDSAAGTSANYTITPTAVTAVTATPAPTTTAVSAVYTVTFTATTALVLGTDTITIASAGTTFPTVAGSAYTVKDGAGAATNVTVGTPASGTVTITTPVTVTIGSAVVVVITGVTNPTAGAHAIAVSTTQDSSPVSSASYTITGPLTAVTAATPTPATATATAMYTVGFNSTSALVAGVGTITIAAPGATVFSGTAGNYTVNGTLVAAAPTGGGTATVTLTTPVAITAGSTVTVIAVRVTNPAVLTNSLTVATSADVTPVASNTYTIAAASGTQVATAVVTPVPATTGVAATYTVTFTATTLVAIGGTITLVGPTGTAFPLVAANYTVKDGAGAVTPVTVLPTGTAGNVTITTPVALTAASAVIVVATGVTNPAVGVVSTKVSTSNDVTALASTFYTITAAAGGGGGAGTPATPVRVSGADRFGTAIAASQVEFPTALSAGAVVLARSDDYPDALVGTALATARNAPLLFANGGALTAGTVTEIQRVLPAGGTVYLLGGLAAVPASVATTLTGLGFVVVRYGGADRFGTSLLVADALGDPSTVLLATGINFPDALAAGPAAAHVAGVVLLTDGTVITAAVQAYLTGHPGKVYAIGGPAVTADPSATPLSGADRYGTAAAVAAALFTAPNNVGVASGTQFPDALSGGAFQGHFGGPIVLTDPGVLPAPTSAYLTSADTTIVTTSIFGGTAALSTAVQASISTALGL